MAAGGYFKEGARPQGCWGRGLTLGRVQSGLHLIQGPMGRNMVSQHRGQNRSLH